MKVAPITKEQAHQIAQVFNGVLGTALAKLTGAIPDTPAPEPRAVLTVAPGSVGEIKVGNADFEDLYQRILRRLSKDDDLFAELMKRIQDACRIDPIMLHMLTSAPPELRIDIEPRLEEVNGNTMRGRVARLLGAGWFDGPRTVGGTRKELARTGTDPGGGGTLGDILNKFTADGFLTREGDGYQKAPGVKVSENVLSTR